MQLPKLGLLAVAWCVWLVASDPAPVADLSPPAVQASPNIVLIVTDDQRHDELDGMPVLQRELIGKGLALTRAYVTDPLCCPSRATILTGQYSHSTSIYANGDNSMGGGYWEFEDRGTVAVWLSEAGYRTAMIGKYQNHYEQADLVPPGWDRWVAIAESNAKFYDYHLSVDGNVVYHGSEPWDYSTDVFAAEAGDFIRSTPRAQPLFLYFAPAAAHGPNTPPERYAGMYDGLALPRGPAVGEPAIEDKPLYLRSLPPLGGPELRARQHQWWNGHATLRAVDDALAVILRALRSTGRLSNTLLVFTSDNGVSLGEHRWMYKMNPHEESIRVPMVIRWDGVVPPGTITEALVANVDLAPTFAEAAGMGVPTSVEGRSMLPLLTQGEPIRDEMLVEHAYIGFPWDPPSYCAVVTADWKLVHYATGEEELYDLEADPYELENLVGNASVAERAALLRGRLRAMCNPMPPGVSPF
jgi:arylsulfatase A-like enzyme